jgi:hypothetical protein
MESYLSGQFGFIDKPDWQCGNSPDWTWTPTQSDGLQLLLTLQQDKLYEDDQPGWVIGIISKTVPLHME